jgi:hypothetical protein
LGLHDEGESERSAGDHLDEGCEWDTTTAMTTITTKDGTPVCSTRKDQVNADLLAFLNG